MIRKAFIVLTSFLTCSCYTMQQGYLQGKLLWKRKPLQKVIDEKQESEERLTKLKWVKPILEFGKTQVGLNIGDSYSTYIPLEDKYLSFIVQAAEKRALKRKTWWFPIVGSQPYLGFFKKEDGIEQQEKLKKEGYDTVFSGVAAFSLLGFFSDPVYSSMLDANDIPQFVELLLHECLHRTVYLPDFSDFNESLAEFVARKATVQFLEGHTEIAFNRKEYDESYKRRLVAQKKFAHYFETARKDLEKFYDAQNQLQPRLSDEQFAIEREKYFDKMSAEFRVAMGGAEKNTYYDYMFVKGKINNAVILGYGLYEAKTEPFERIYEKSGKSVPQFLTQLRKCIEPKPKNEKELWERMESCGGPS